MSYRIACFDIVLCCIVAYRTVLFALLYCTAADHPWPPQTEWRSSMAYNIHAMYRIVTYPGVLYVSYRAVSRGTVVELCRSLPSALAWTLAPAVRNGFAQHRIVSSHIASSGIVR